MRQVIERFLKHLQAERNATAATLESYRYDLSKFDGYSVKRLGTRFLPGDVSREPVLCHIQRYPLCMPQYNVGHLERIQSIEERVTHFPTLALAGKSYRGVGIANCIHSGEEAAERIVERLLA